MRSRLLAAGIVLVALALAVSAAAAAKADFSGTWALDVSRSEGLPPSLQQTVTITQEGDKIDMVIKQKTPQGERTINDSFMLDGKQAAFNPPAPPPPNPQPKNGKRTARWLPDGGIEVHDLWDVDTPDGLDTMEMKRKFTLAPDGKTFTVEQSFKGMIGLSQTKRVYVKQG
ncbi:MAG TPA: hypothetical protein VD835_09395 [Pyrinomonadaceae bacterium]|nr:hypothetical protein [Pyrinomonadaceae bacterium]